MGCCGGGSCGAGTACGLFLRPNRLLLRGDSLMSGTTGATNDGGGVGTFCAGQQTRV